MRYEIIEDAESVDGDAWRVESVDYQGDGSVYVAIFSGPDARQRAEEYAEWKNRTKIPERSAVSA
jgi:hypothetical protein